MLGILKGFLPWRLLVKTNGALIIGSNICIFFQISHCLKRSAFPLLSISINQDAYMKAAEKNEAESRKNTGCFNRKGSHLKRVECFTVSLEGSLNQATRNSASNHPIEPVCPVSWRGALLLSLDICPGLQPWLLGSEWDATTCYPDSASACLAFPSH